MADFKIYTRKGDSGNTSLMDGSRVLKSSKRLMCYGTVDELNSFIGLLKDKIGGGSLPDKKILVEKLKRIQNQLFNLGCELSDPNFNPEKNLVPIISIDNVSILENEMDFFQNQLKPLKNFILPGGHELNSLAHICRTICRRTERHLIELSIEEPNLRKEPIKYVNRLSDWFFVISRYLAHSLEIEESIWEK